jgi:hypothetical protein
MTLNIAHWSHFGIIIFSVILIHIEIFVSPWHKFKNSVVVWIRLLHSQSFMNNHCYFFVIVESVTSQMLFHLPNNLLWGIVFQHNTQHTLNNELLLLFHWELLDCSPYSFGHRNNIWKAIYSMKTGRYKCLFINGFQYRGCWLQPQQNC